MLANMLSFWLLEYLYFFMDSFKLSLRLWFASDSDTADVAPASAIIEPADAINEIDTIISNLYPKEEA